MMEILKLQNRRYFTKEYLSPAIKEKWIAPYYFQTIQNTPSRNTISLRKGNN